MAIIQRVPLYQQAYQEIRERIARGDLVPGMRIDIQILADEMEISRTPIREAVRQLVQEGLLEDAGDGRVRVYSPSPKDLAEIYIVRSALESAAAAVLVSTGTAEDFQQLEAAFNNIAEADESGDGPATARFNTDFHELIVQLSGSIYSQRLLGIVRIMAVRYRQLSMQYPARREQAHAGHAEILRLFQARDPRVEDYVRQHVLDAGSWAISSLKPQEDGDSRPMKYLRSHRSVTAGVPGLDGRLGAYEDDGQETRGDGPTTT